MPLKTKICFLIIKLIHSHQVKFRKFISPAGVAQWIEYGPTNQRVAGLIPSQGTCLGCGPGLQ